MLRDFGPVETCRRRLDRDSPITCPYTDAGRVVLETTTGRKVGRPWGRRLTGVPLGAQVELQARRDGAELPQGARLELADALAGDAEVGADLLERLRLLAVETEAALGHVAHARVQPLERLRELGRARVLRRLLLGRGGAVVLDQVGVHRLAVADRRLEGDGVLDQVEELGDALGREPGLLRDLLGRGIAV